MCKKIKIEEHLGLVKSIAIRFTDRGAEYDDLYQIGCIGLIKAAENFNYELGYKFSTYAFNVISGEIKMFLRNNSLIKVSRKLKDIYVDCLRIQKEYVEKEGSTPTLNTLTELTGYTKADILDSYEANSACLSIYEQTSEDGYIADFLTKGETENLSENFKFEDMISILDEKSKTVLRLRILYDKTQREISELMSLSQVQISRIEKAAIKKLKSVI